VYDGRREERVCGVVSICGIDVGMVRGRWHGEARSMRSCLGG
jgi:hypothetical protein